MEKSILDKAYNPKKVEDYWYNHWLKKNYFRSDSKSKKEPYTILIPPPNVTGKLTMGHVLNNTIQDILIRKARMEGKEACWVPGTDHASIATEAKVMKMLDKKGVNTSQLDREEFLTHAWKWKEKYGGIIIKQLKKLGCSCDWDRETFTMDSDYSKSVLSAFVMLYKKGLIYKGHRLVNWCPVSKSAISDEEVVHQEKNGHLWHIRYPIESTSDYLVVATTRPETMLGDTAVAVHPQDERYKDIVGKTIVLPIIGRSIPIITDDYVDPDFGSGCIKVTPGHDQNDFDIGLRHDLEIINIMNDDASLNTKVPDQYIGLSREKARIKIVSDLESLGLIDKIEDYVHKVGYSERGNVPIEFFMSEQWFMKMDKLVKPALKAVESGEIKFYPDHWVKTYKHWMKNIKDWCISRQLWWGHRIPVWYNKKDPSVLHVSVEGPSDLENWVQDKDVLDTWASSWLWPLAVHDWPNKKNGDISKFFPSNTLVTGPDIIFFWVARMVIAGYEFMGQKPFKDVYFTSLLRDKEGRKLSKSLGNSPDPIDLFQEYGTDAVRFGIMLMSPQGVDVFFSKSRLDIGRNFMNKLWNACRFIQLNTNSDFELDLQINKENLALPEKWILSRMENATETMIHQLERFNFNEAAKVIYEFTWSDFCDWYIEICKVRFQNQDLDLSNISRAICFRCVQVILRLLHPYAPFITEQLWLQFKPSGSKDLIISSFPKCQNKYKNKTADQKMEALKNIVISIRSTRSRMNVPPSKLSELFVRCKEEERMFLLKNASLIKTLSKTKHIECGPLINKPKQSSSSIVDGMELFIPLGSLVDLDKETKRMNKRIHDINKLISNINNKLNNENFIERAPESVVLHEKSNLSKLNDELHKIKSNLENII